MTTLCIFCAPEPCQCVPATPKKAPSKGKTTGRVGSPAAPPLAKPTPEVPMMTDDQAGLLGAVRVLAAVFELEGPDYEQLKPHLAAPASLDERAGAWRFQHRHRMKGS